MDILTAAGILNTLLSTATNLMANGSAISTLIAKAQTENRTTFTPDEWAVIVGADDAARKVLADAIAKAGG